MTDFVPKPKVTHLGMVAGQWPVTAFASEDQAAYWSSQGTTDRPRYIWPIVEISLGDRLVGHTEPARHVLRSPEGA